MMMHFHNKKLKNEQIKISNHNLIILITVGHQLSVHELIETQFIDARKYRRLTLYVSNYEFIKITSSNFTRIF